MKTYGYLRIYLEVLGCYQTKFLHPCGALIMQHGVSTADGTGVHTLHATVVYLDWRQSTHDTHSTADRVMSNALQNSDFTITQKQPARLCSEIWKLAMQANVILGCLLPFVMHWLVVAAAGIAPLAWTGKPGGSHPPVPTL